MYASWYDRQGPAADVLRVGELPDPQPGPGEVRVRVTVSGVNPGDTKKRRSDDFPAEAKQRAARDLTAAAAAGAVAVDVGHRYSLDQIAQAHERVDASSKGRVLVTIPQ